MTANDAHRLEWRHGLFRHANYCNTRLTCQLHSAAEQSNRESSTFQRQLHHNYVVSPAKIKGKLTSTLLAVVVSRLIGLPPALQPIPVSSSTSTVNLAVFDQRRTAAGSVSAAVTTVACNNLQPLNHRRKRRILFTQVRLSHALLSS